MLVLTPELLLSAYTIGLFPMANDRDDPTVNWIEPRVRGILPFKRFHIPKSLRKTIRKTNLEIKVDGAFRQVIEACAQATMDRPRTWLNDELIDVYVKLYETGHAHSIECWDNGQLAGGLYGVSLGGAFFGESMFQRQTDASKIALVELYFRLKAGNYALLDTQFTTPHLKQFGAVDVSRADYRKKLRAALNREARMPKSPFSFAKAVLTHAAGSQLLADGNASLQSSTQTS